jgi:predicted nucleotidyltransferase
MARRLERSEILRTLEDHRDELRRLGVRRIGLFGSFLHGDPGPASDIDLLVAFERSSFDDYMDTKFLLEELFGRRVDLVTEKALKPALRRVRDEAAYARGF